MSCESAIWIDDPFQPDCFMASALCIRTLIRGQITFGGTLDADLWKYLSSADCNGEENCDIYRWCGVKFECCMASPTTPLPLHLLPSSPPVCIPAALIRSRLRGHAPGGQTSTSKNNVEQIQKRIPDKYANTQIHKYKVEHLGGRGWWVGNITDS